MHENHCETIKINKNRDFQRKLAVKNTRNAKIDFWWFLRRAKLLLWLGLERFFIMFIFWIGKNYHKTIHTVHIFVRNLIWKLSTALRNHEFSILLPTSEGCRSAPRWNWMTSKYTRAMYSSRYVDFWGLKLKPINLTVRNPVVKFVEFGENPESGLAPPYPCCRAIAYSVLNFPVGLSGEIEEI